MPNANQIVTTAAVLENPRIKDKTKIINTFSAGERRENTNRYWADVDIPERRRKMFPIEYWALDLLMRETGQVALLVSNIHDPNQVTASWIIYDPANTPVMDEHGQCFVLTEPYYSGIMEILELPTSTHNVEGIARIKTHGLGSNFLLALLGKDTEGKYELFLQNVTATLIESDPNGSYDTSPGGEGTGGLKLPR